MSGAKPVRPRGGHSQYVTIRLGGQMFGLPIEKVQDVFIPDNFTPVPLARAQIAGVLNLRGRIVTMIDLAKILGVDPVNRTIAERPAAGVLHANESYGLLTDSVGEVVTLADAELEPNPINLCAAWSDVSQGTFKLEAELLVILDIDALIEDLLRKDAA
ncbi:MAG: chemotaxis protein CheW [Hyphomicrobiaceae bacterium]|nr:chemotaxis protein CheW [Hyphomicrobiaceae bacterium]